MTNDQNVASSHRPEPTRPMLDDFIVFAVLAAPSAYFFLQDDLISLGMWLLAAVITLIGYRIGLVMHLALIVSLFVLADLGEPTARLIQEPITQGTGLTGLANRIIGFIIAVMFVLTLVLLASRWVTRGFLSKGNRHRWNHWLGFTVGSIEGFVVLALIIGVFSTLATYQRENAVQSWANSETEMNGKTKFLAWVKKTGTDFEESQLGDAFVGPRPLVDVKNWGPVRQVGNSFEFVSKPSSIKSLEKFPAYQRLVSDDSVNDWLKSLRNDKTVKEMFRSSLPLTAKQVWLLLNHPSIMGLLDEPVFRSNVLDLLDELDASKIDPPAPKTMF